VASASCSQRESGTLAAAADTLKADTLKSIADSGTGKWFQFGQAPNPTLPWACVRPEPLLRDGGIRPSGGARRDGAHPGSGTRARAARACSQRPIQLVNGKYAWNLATLADLQSAIGQGKPSVTASR
jgi:hypothetical protein